jgi:hypothetical protein
VQRTPDAINPNRFLSGALIPAAAVVTGAGLVVGRRLRRKEAGAAPAADPQAEARTSVEAVATSKSDEPRHDGEA